MHIFSICMALHCSKKAGSDMGTRVLENYILQIAEISEHERDELIKKRMVRSTTSLPVSSEYFTWAMQSECSL